MRHTHNVCLYFFIVDIIFLEKMRYNIKLYFIYELT